MVLSSVSHNMQWMESELRMFDIVPVGHFAIDSILLPGRLSPFVVLGGSATYVSLAARRLETRVSIISKVGADFPEAYRWWLGQEGIDLSGIIKDEKAQTTRFELKYSNTVSDRLLTLKNRAPPITVDDLPKSLKAEIIHIAPIAGEITYEVAEKLKTYTEVLSLDPQGLLRNFDEAGNVSLGPISEKRILGIIDIYKSSLTEIEAVTGQTEPDSAIEAIHKLGAKIVIVTLGGDGAVVSTGDTSYYIPVYKPEKIVDPTGAGDAFIGGFLAEYACGESYLRCACVGSAVASLVVEGIGPTSFGDKAEIYRRGRLLYEKEIKE